MRRILFYSTALPLHSPDNSSPSRIALAILPAPMKPIWSLLKLLWPDILRLFATGAVGELVAAILVLVIIIIVNYFAHVGGESWYNNFTTIII